MLVDLGWLIPGMPDFCDSAPGHSALGVLKFGRALERRGRGVPVFRFRGSWRRSLDRPTETLGLGGGGCDLGVWGSGLCDRVAELWGAGSWCPRCPV